MAYSPIEDKYLSALTAMQFPDEPVEVVMPEQTAPGTQPGDVLLAEAGISRGMPEEAYTGRYPDTIKPIDSTIKQRLADFLQSKFVDLGMDQYKARKNAQTLIGGPSSNLPLDIGLADFAPFLGTTMQMEESGQMLGDAVSSAKRGDYGTAALQTGGAALGLVPGALSTIKATKKLAPKAGEMIGNYMERSGLQMNLIAYHGTPHTINKFDASKIGTGEGAQAYGLGLYFAESPDVANSYRIALSYDPEKMKVGGKQINQVYKSIENKAASMPANKAQGEYEKLELLESLMLNNRLDDVQKSADQMLPTTKAWFEKSVKPSFETYGNLYTVDIPDGMVSKMLDWDKPINKQDPSVREIIAKAFPSGYINGKFVDPLNSPATGRAMLDELGMIANKRNEPGFRSTETALRQAGVPGIRYLDEGSRGTGKGTRNIVVFPGGENEIKIIKSEGKK